MFKNGDNLKKIIIYSENHLMREDIQVAECGWATYIGRGQDDVWSQWQVAADLLLYHVAR